MKTDVILKRLLALHPNKLIDLKLDRMERLLAEMGRPQDRLPPVIHVAGTNGKGSTIAFMRAILEAAGKTVHVYTSPHLVHFRERIRLKSNLVSNRQLNDALQRCEAVNAGKPITYFEITTAAAILLFAEVKADYLLLEVGLGGRYDATNVIPEKLGCVVTPVSLDHQDFLGSEVGEIAREKAGIFVEGSKAVMARQVPDAEAAIEREAEKLNVDLIRAGEDFDGYAQRGRLVFQNEDGLMDLPPPNLTGPFQNDNATVAIAALQHFGIDISQEHVEAGLINATWPGRMMSVKSGALFDLLPAGTELWIDGGHNPAGAEVLSQALRALHKRSPKKLSLVWGTFSNKDATGYLTPFAALQPEIIGVQIRGDRTSFSASQLRQFATDQGFEARTARSIAGAFRQLGAAPPHRVVVCGSLHFVGHFLKQNRTIPT